MATVLLAPGVFRIPTLGDYINSFAFVEEDGSVTLVDCGIKRAPARIVAGLASFGKHPHDVQRIVLTHAHPDHAGGAAQMVKETGVSGVTAHEDDTAYLREGSSPPRDKSSTSGRVFSRLSSSRFAPVAVDEEITDGTVLPVAGGLLAIHTPGHTPGHVSLLHQGSGVLITGDSIFNMNSRMRWPYAAFCTSFAQAKATAVRLGDYDFEVAAFTHGPEIREKAQSIIRSFVTRR